MTQNVHFDRWRGAETHVMRQLCLPDPPAPPGLTAASPEERDELPCHPHRIVVGHQEPGAAEGSKLRGR
jgi:hypothetical protein